MNFIKTNVQSLFLLATLLLIPFLANAQTQGEMDAQSYKSFKQADAQLNLVYNQILKEYSAQKAFIKNFKTAQRIWLQLRDAELAAMYTNDENYGTVEPMCKSLYLKELTINRTKFIKRWLTGVVEGDVCSGTVRIKH